MEKFKLIIATNLFIIKDDKLLLSLRKNTGFADGMFNIVGGHLEKNESVKEGAIREGNEEIGIVISKDDLQLAHVVHDMSNIPRIQFYFICKKWQGEISNTEPDKCVELKWFSLDKLPKNLLPSTEFVIKKYVKGLVYSEFKDDRKF